MVRASTAMSNLPRPSASNSSPMAGAVVSWADHRCSVLSDAVPHAGASLSVSPRPEALDATRMAPDAPQAS